MKYLDIGDVASCSGVTTSPLHYYEKTGLISSVARPAQAVSA